MKRSKTMSRLSMIVMGSLLVAGCSTQFQADGGDDDPVPDVVEEVQIDVPADAPDAVDAPDVPTDGGAECGNGDVEGDEECDDGNDVNGDGKKEILLGILGG